MADKIRTLIQSSLKLPKEKINNLIQIIVETGVEDEEDLPHVKESDLTPILKPIQARKLLSFLYGMKKSISF